MMRIAFTIEVILFSCFYYYGMCGMRDIYQLQDENSALEQQIAVAHHEIELKEQELHAWGSDPFYKEKLAREQLHMAKEGEEIYLLSGA
jgi:cell division protein FtsB